MKINSTRAKEETNQLRKYFELNKNANKSYQIFWNIVKAVLIIKFTVVIIYIGKEQRSKIN